MKKVLLALFVLFTSINLIYGQAFQKGNWNVDAGIGIGGYATQTTIQIPLPFFGNVTATDNDGAASVIIPVGVEYGISNRFGLGLQIGFSNYFLDDSTEVKNPLTGQATGQMQENNTQSVTSVDFALKFNFHLLQAEKNDLFVGLALGGSSIKWQWKNVNNNNNSNTTTEQIETLTGSGGYSSLYITDRIFFSDRFGIYFNLGYTAYNYTNVTSNSSSNVAINNLNWTAKGFNLGTGLALKF